MKSLLLFLALSFLMLGVTSTAYGQLTFSFIETEFGVESFGEGSVDLSGLNFGGGFTGGGLFSADWTFEVGLRDDVDVYLGNEDGPDTLTSDEPSENFLATETAGDTFGFNFGSAEVDFLVPKGYVSNDPLSGSAFYAGETLETLSLLEGQYIWTIDADAVVTLNVGVAPVPEPTTSLCLSVLLMLAVSSRRRMAY